MQRLLPDLAPPCWITLTYSPGFPAWVASFENARGFGNCCIAPYWFTIKSTKTNDSSKSFTSATGHESRPQICPSREWHIHCFICVRPAFVWAVERPAGQARDPLTRPAPAEESARAVHPPKGERAGAQFPTAIWRSGSRW